MGVIYEFNWYLVAESENAYILQEDSTTYILKKSEKRIYPIGFSIPLIIKNKGCIAEVKITKVEVE